MRAGSQRNQEETANIFVIYYGCKWMKKLSQTISSFASTSFWLFFFLLPLLSSKQFQNNYALRTHTSLFNIFLLKYNWKKWTWKVFFGCQSLGAQTGIPFYKTAWKCHCICYTLCVNFNLNSGVSNKKVTAFYR